MTANTDMETFKICTFDKKYQADINSLMADIQQEFPDPFSAPDSKTISQLTEANGDIFWVVLHQDKVVGSVGLSRFDSTKAVLKRMFVVKKYRGNQYKISQRLLDTAISKAKELGISDIYLGTMTQFKAAQNFYIKNNFTQIAMTDLPDKMFMSSLDTLFFKLKLKLNNP